MPNYKRVLDSTLGALTFPFVLLGIVVGIAYSRFKDGVSFAHEARNELYWR